MIDKGPCYPNGCVAFPMRPDDLLDDARYVAVPNVPVLTAGDGLSPEILRLFARNAEARSRRGTPIRVQLGFVDPAEGVPEERQPEPVGFASDPFLLDAGEGARLVVTLHMRRGREKAVQSHPVITVEGVLDANTPELNLVDAVVLLPPGQAATPRFTSMVRYSREPLPPGATLVRHYRASLQAVTTSRTRRGERSAAVSVAQAPVVDTRAGFRDNATGKTHHQLHSAWRAFHDAYRLMASSGRL